MKREIITNSARETRRIGEVLAEEIIGTETKRALIIGLEGELGSGKTTFIQGMANGFGIKESITSPTFVILKKYKTNVLYSMSCVLCLYHIDCYRIKSKDLLELGFKEISNNRQNVIVIEWAERVRKVLKNALWIKFEYVDKNKRKIVVVN